DERGVRQAGLHVFQLTPRAPASVRRLTDRCHPLCFNSGMKPLDLVYFADPMCSWCYGFGRELAGVIGQESLRRTVKLDLIMGGLRAYNTAAMDADAKRTTRSHWEQVREKTGLAFEA